MSDATQAGRLQGPVGSEAPGDDLDGYDEALADDEVSLVTLQGRVEAERAAQEADTTHRFPVPGISSLFVEMRPVGRERQERIGLANRTAPKKVRELYNIVDTMRAATVSFHAVVDPKTGRTKRVAASENNWLSVARLKYPKIGDVTERVAVLRLLRTEENPAPAYRLFADYSDWCETQGESVVAELELGFDKTP